jgi:uncharacterized protein
MDGTVHNTSSSSPRGTIHMDQPQSELRLLEEKAKQNPEAQFDLGAKYYDGDGVPQDNAKAFDLIKQSADRRYHVAQRTVGMMLAGAIDVGIKQDLQEAFKYYERSAEQGDSYAQYSLGDMYETGFDGLPKDNKKALMYYQQSAKNGNPNAQYRLGEIYRTGFMGHPTADRLDQAYAKNVRIINKKLALEYYTLSAKEGHTDAQFMLGQANEIGWLDVEVDEDLALEYYKLSAEKKHPNALYRLGMAYTFGQLGAPKDKVKADEYLSDYVKHAQDLSVPIVAQKYKDQMDTHYKKLYG